MKKTIFTLLITCITILSFAQSGINYQAVVRDAVLQPDLQFIQKHTVLLLIILGTW